MKVPVYDAPQAEARADVPGGINLVEPNNEALQRGIDRGADAFGKGVAQAQEQYEKFKHEARSADVANGLAAYANDATDKFHGAPPDAVDAGSGPDAKVVDVPVPPGAMADALPPASSQPTATGPDTGFLGTRGKAAAAAEQPLFDSLAKRRDQIAAGFTDPETKKLFLSRVQGFDRDLREKALVHVSQQAEVASQDAAANISDAAVRAAAADPGNDKLAAALFGEARGAVHGLHRGEDFDAKHDRELRADIASVRLDNLLAPGPQQDVAKAREVLEANRGVLGKQLDNYERLLGKTNVGIQAEALASEIVKSSTRPDGSFNDRAALDKLDKVPADLADDVRPRLYRRMTEAEQAYKAESARVSQKAFSAYNAGGWGGISEGLKQQLNQRNPELYDRLKNEERRKFRENRSDSAEARRQQAAANKAAMLDYLSRPLNDRVDLNLQEEYFDSGADPRIGIPAIAAQQVKDRTALAKGGAVNSSSFVEQAYADAVGFLPAPGLTQQTKAAAREAVQDFKAEAERAWVDFVGKNERSPNAKEAGDLKAQLIRTMRPNPKSPETSARAGAAIARDLNARTGGAKTTVVGTGVFKTDKNGVRWEKMSDGTARQVK